jgi:hypothetical protein
MDSMITAAARGARNGKSAQRVELHRLARRCAGSDASRHRDGTARRSQPRQDTAATRGPSGLRWPTPVPDLRGSHPEGRSGNRPRGHDHTDTRRRRSGMAWAEGTLWVGQHRKCKIHRVDPETGAILRTIESNRFVTGVTWVDGMSGLESNGSDTFFCGGGSSGKVRAVRRPTRGSAAKPQN